MSLQVAAERTSCCVAILLERFGLGRRRIGRNGVSKMASAHQSELGRGGPTYQAFSSWSLYAAFGDPLTFSYLSLPAQ